MTTGRTIVAGDVHGMLPELVGLLERVGLTCQDHLVMVGDLLDKGPDSPGVVRHVRGLRESGHRLTLVKGNHEEKHERFRRAFAQVGDAVRMKAGTRCGLLAGAVFGGRLATAVLVGREAPEFVSVPSRGRFATAYWE